MVPGFVLAGVLTLIIGTRIVCHFMDKDRIRAAIDQKGGIAMEISWNPFGPGWRGEKGERHYRVIYRNSAGQIVRTGCKTSLLTGVYWTGQEDILCTDPRVPPNGSRCRTCGYALHANWIACPRCGRAVPPKS